MGNSRESSLLRELDPGYIEEFCTSRPQALPALPPPSPPLSPSPVPQPPPPPQQLQLTPPPSRHSRPCSAGGVQLRIKNRRSDPASRPHSWHSTKLVEVQQEADPATMDTMSSTWHHNYHPSASTTDLSSGFDSGTYLRKSPDQYSSRGSMESLDQPMSSQHHPGAQHHHPLGRHNHSGSHPAYSSCHQLSSARSSNSIDLLHSKRDSAYSSFSTSSSIPEYLASTPSFSPERSYSLEVVSHRGGGSGEMQPADMCYSRTAYDGHQGLSPEHEIRSASAVLTCNSSSSRGSSGAPPSQSREGRAVGVCYRGSSSGSSSSGSSSSGSGAAASNRHSVGPIWGPTATCSSYENLKGAPAPPRRSDSYAAIRNHERPNSWSSLEQGRSLRSLQKGSWHHSSGPLASGAAKGPFSIEGQLHTVMEKSPESSPTTKPRQGGGFPTAHSPPETLSGPAAQSGQYILPTGKYQVPQPEPHYAHVPSTNQPGPGCSGVYSALVKESSRQQQQQQQKVHGVRVRQEDASDGHRDERSSAAENGFLTNSLSFCNSSSASAPSQADRPPHDDSKSGHHRSYPKPECQVAGAQRTQNHPGGQNKTTKSSIAQAPQASYRQTYQELTEDFHHQTAQPVSPGRRATAPSEWRDPYTSELYSGDRRRSLDQNSISSEPAVPTPRSPARAQPQAPPPAVSHQPARHISDSSAQHYQQWDQQQRDRDREHPLTRLEIALAEVQRCPTPDSQGQGGHSPAHSLSVLEKVSRFERRERAGMQLSHSNSIRSNNKGSHLRNQIGEKSRGSSCGAEDLRNMLERSTSAAKAQRTLSFRGGGSETKYRTAVDPSSALQRSRSSFQLKESRRGDETEDLDWRQDIQELVGPTQDAPYHRSYRDCVKDAQSRVLRSTSLRRRDLSSSISPAPPAAAPSSSHQPPSGPARPLPVEKRGPKTMPKPQGVFVTSHSPPTQTLAPPPPLTSPHAPKERHVVSPDLRGLDPPALPRVPPVGPPSLLRICGRKRMAVGQKKRSYSEPENLNEVGVSDPETIALFRRGGETSVADRRRMFELAATRTADAVSRTDLRQLQQDALAEYMERKKGLKREEGQQRGGARPRSAYLLPESSRGQTVCHSDTGSLSSTSSLLSLQESADRSCSPGGKRVSSTLPPGSDLRSFESNVFYPGRVTTPRPPAYSQPSGPTGAPPDLKVQALQDVAPAAELCGRTQHPQGVSKKLTGALQRVQSTRRSGRSASAEDLLERCEEKPIASQHLRSRSSPTGDKLVLDFPAGDVRTFGVFVCEPGRHSLSEDRPADTQASAGFTSHSHRGPSTSSRCNQPADTSHDAGSSLTNPVTRRERPARRSSERPWTSGASTLAASVGLPCPFSPPGAAEAPGDAEWHLSQKLDQANLDAITFPGLPDTSEESGGGTGGGGGAAAPEEACREERLSSLRISESSLLVLPVETPPPEDCDDVFLRDPPPAPSSPPPPPPLTETPGTEVEDLPLPPPPQSPPPALAVDPQNGLPALERSSFPSPTLTLSTLHPPPAVSLHQRAQGSAAAEQSLALDYQPLPRREKTPEELRVETLARQLVLQDGSLAPLFDMFGGKSTLELMEEIFSNKVVARSPWQRRSSRRMDDRLLDGVNSLVKDHQKETNLDEFEKDLNTKKLELCEALRCHLEALRQEKEALREELRLHHALGAGVEVLVQEQLKANERDKYSVFIGDLEKIVNLLLSLCSRLSRIDRSLLALEGEELTREGAAEERDSLLHKRSLLLSQTEDARELKENLERRQRVVHAILSAHLGEQQLRDYRHFVSAKPSLLIRQRHLDNLLRQAEEQLSLLSESLPPELAQAHGLAGVPGFLPAPSPTPFPALVVAPAPLHRPTAVTSL